MTHCCATAANYPFLTVRLLEVSHQLHHNHNKVGAEELPLLYTPELEAHEPAVGRVHHRLYSVCHINTKYYIYHCSFAVSVPLDPITFVEGNTTMALGSENATSSIDLSCTVTNEGRFDITWTLPSAATTYQRVSLDATRTSRLQVSRLTASHAGDYVCQASYAADAVLPGQTAPLDSIRIITVNLEGKPYITCVPTQLG